VLLLAHVGHYAIWLLYAVPVLIVSAAIVKSYVSQRQAIDAPPAGGDDREDSAGRQSPESETGPAGRRPSR
jgi:heme exporter protein D